MPKRPRFKNLLKLDVGRSTPAQPTLEAPLQPNHANEPTPDAPIPLQPSSSAFFAPIQPQSSHGSLVPPQPCLGACTQPSPSHQVPTTSPLSFIRAPTQSFSSHQTPPSMPQPSVGAPTQPSTSFQASPATPVQPDAPASSSRQISGRQSKHFWTVDGIDAQGATKKLKLKVSDIFNLEEGVRVVVEFGGELAPYGEAAGLLAGVCGMMAIKPDAFPINFTSWDKIPEDHFKNCWRDIFEPRFHFVTTEVIAKRFVNISLNKKWRESRNKLWAAFNDPTMSRNSLIANVPEGIPRDQWANYVDYRLDQNTQEMCRRNTANRRKQTIPHTCGAKSLRRRSQDMFVETGQRVGRGPMYIVTHKKKDGSYVNTEAERIVAQIEENMRQNPASSSEISADDPVGKVLGKEHPGRVRSLGMGAVPTCSFTQSTRRLGGIHLSSMGEPSRAVPELENTVVSLRTELKETRESHMLLQNAFLSYVQMKEGRIPEEFATIIGQTTLQPGDIGSGQDSPANGRRSSGGSNQN